MKARYLDMRIAMLIIAATTAACTPDRDQDSGPPLTVSDVELFAPLPGSHAAVGYLSLHNRGDAPLIINKVSSSNFGDVQMHETVIRDGVARMQALPSVTIEAESSVEFAAGGKHLMLMQPTAGTAAGSNIMLEIQYDAAGILIINATIQSRLPAK